MIEFEATGWDFETREDLAYALEEVVSQLNQGYKSGSFNGFSWDTSGEEECSCLDCGELFEEGDTIDPDGHYCTKCYRLRENNDDD
jgi:hypothetical protein